MGKNKEKKTILKVVISYLILIAIGIGSIYFVYRNTESITDEIGMQSTYQQQEELVNTILTELLNAENHIGPMLVDTTDFNLYKEKVAEASDLMDTLKSTLSDPFQIQSLDSVAGLLKQKEENLCELTKLTNRDNLENLYKANIKTMLNGEDMKNFANKHNFASQKQDTTIQKRYAKRGNFFQRLAEAFSKNGGPTDTTITMAGLEQKWMDSLAYYYNPTDSAQRIIDDIKLKIRDEKYRTDKAIMAKINTLRENNNNITKQTKSILGKIEFDNRVNMRQAKARRNETMSQTAETLRYIIILAIVIILIFCWILFNDISRSRELRKLLEEKNKQQEKMMISLTHDMKAPLGSAIGYMELMDNTPLSEKQEYYLSSMRKSSNQTLQLITNILDNNKLEYSKIVLQPTYFSVKEMIEDVYISFNPIADKKGLALHRSVTGEPDRIKGDVIRIQQICNNLVSNAIKFTEKGSVNIIADVEEDEENYKLTIEVADTGIGISGKDKEKIFGEYERIVREDHTQQEGSGLGLSIVKRLVDLHNGDIKVESAIDEGTRFIVQLELEKVDEEENNALSNESAPIHVLVLDDDDTQLRLISEVLSHEQNITVFTQKDPMEALKTMESEEIDIILTDIQMPSINGFEFVKLIRQSSHIKNSGKLPIIALSARADISDESIKEQGFNGFICKPFNMQQLKDVVRLHTQGISATVGNPTTTETEKKEPNGFDELLGYACGDKESEAMILDSFIQESNMNLENLSKAWKENKNEEVKHFAHKMLPLFRTLQKKEIIEKLTILERDEAFKEKVSNKDFNILRNAIAKTIGEAKKYRKSYNQ